MISLLPKDIIHHTITFLEIIDGFIFAKLINEKVKGVKIFGVVVSENSEMVKKLCNLHTVDKQHAVYYDALINLILYESSELESYKHLDVIVSNEVFIWNSKVYSENVIKYIFRLIIKYDALDFFTSIMNHLYKVTNEHSPSGHLNISRSHIYWKAPEPKKSYKHFEHIYLGEKYYDEPVRLLYLVLDEEITCCPRILDALLNRKGDYYNELRYSKIMNIMKRNIINCEHKKILFMFSSN